MTVLIKVHVPNIIYSKIKSFMHDIKKKTIAHIWILYIYGII